MAGMIAGHSFFDFMLGYLLAVLFLFLLVWELVRLYQDYLGAQWECTGVLVEKKALAFPSPLVLLAWAFLYLASYCFRRYFHPRLACRLVFEVEGEQRKFTAPPELYGSLQEGRRYRLRYQGNRIVLVKKGKG